MLAAVVSLSVKQDTNRQALGLTGFVLPCLQQPPYWGPGNLSPGTNGHKPHRLQEAQACQLCSPMPAAATVAPRSLCPNTSRPQDLYSLASIGRFKPTGFAAPWASSTLYSVPGAHCQIYMWTLSSRLCTSAGFRRLPSPQSTVGEPLLLHQRAGTQLLH
jgi:hypothetical protein